MPRARRQELPWWAIAVVLVVAGIFVAFPRVQQAYNTGLSWMGVAVLGLVLLLFGLVGLFMMLNALATLPLYRKARAVGVQVTLGQLLGMRVRGVDTTKVLKAATLAREHHLPMGIAELESLLLAGGHPFSCVEALAEAHRRGMHAGWIDIYALDLAGRDVLAIVRAGHDPKGLVGSNRLSGDAFRRL